MDVQWTLDELVSRVDAALTGEAYPGAPNGRIRDVPDRRAVRWYATIGLVDRPGGHRGRTALYGTRHLLQLVAVKRRQAEGRALAEIQAELSGASDATLRRIAAVPPALLGGEAVTPTVAAAPVRARFWLDRPASPTGEPAGSAGPEEPAVPDGSLADAATPGGSAGAAAAAVPTEVVEAGAVAATAPGEPVRIDVFTGVRLLGGAVLLVPGSLHGDDLTAIQAAAGPLLDLLADRGLLHLDAQRSPR